MMINFIYRSVQIMITIKDDIGIIGSFYLTTMSQAHNTKHVYMRKAYQKLQKQ